MKKLAILTAMLLTMLMLTAAAQPAPILPTRDFYVNDNATAIFREHHSKMLRLANQVQTDTGVQIVVLVVKDLSDMDVYTYSRAIMDRWYIGNPVEKNGILLLAVTGEDIYHIEMDVNSPLRDYLTDTELARIEEDVIRPYANTGNVSKGVLEGFKAIAVNVYDHYGIEPDEELAAQFFSGEGEKSHSTYPFVMLAGILLLTSLSVRKARRYRSRMGKGYVYQRKSFSSPRREYDDVTDREVFEPHQYNDSRNRRP